MTRPVRACVLALLVAAFGPVAGVSADDRPDPADDFVTVDNGLFMWRGEPYRFVGTNVWYAAYLGREDAHDGDRERLVRELDLLLANGITNLRILGASERSPLDNSMSPAISYRGAVEREDILIGLDFVLAEMRKRDMKAVIFLNNFWEWSGGMATYLSWVTGGRYINLGDPEHPWPEFALFSARFYSNQDATQLYEKYITEVIKRRNTITGISYADDPTIMSWQLANEPRPGDRGVSIDNLPAYYAWIRNTSKLIRSMAPRQLISIGSEGTMGCIELRECFLDAHSGGEIDYATFHMWPKNWGWFDAGNPDETFDDTLERAGAYIDEHITLASQLGMPLVLEEFGVERDGGSYAPGSSVQYRDRFFRYVFDRIEKDGAQGGPLAGSNFWTWGGFGRAAHTDAAWREGDTSFTGDPPQEAQGLNSVFDTDASTLGILRAHASALE